MNNCNFIGRAGKDAVLRHTQGGDPVLGWSLAVDAGYGDRKVTTWLDCTLWGKRAESLADKIAKGDRIGVTGELSHREHDGKTYITLRVADVTLLAGKRDGENFDRPQRGGGTRPQRSTGPTGGDEAFPDDDIPFVTNRSAW